MCAVYYNWLHITLIVYEFQALQYTLYQHVIVTPDSINGHMGVATEFKRTGTLSKRIQNTIQRKRQRFVKASNMLIM